MFHSTLHVYINSIQAEVIYKVVDEFDSFYAKVYAKRVFNELQKTLIGEKTECLFGNIFHSNIQFRVMDS